VSILIYCVSCYRFIEIGVLVVRMFITIWYPGASRLSPIKKLKKKKTRMVFGRVSTNSTANKVGENF